MNVRRVVGAIAPAVAVLLVMGALAAPAAAQTGVTPAQSQAWTESLALEVNGDLVKAREVIVSAYGAQPESYQPCVRLAWLSMQMKHGREAVELYRRARQLPGALPEATQGLVLALARAGYEELDRGDLPTARRDWQEALRLDAAQAAARAGMEIVGPSSGASPEAWVGRLSATSGSSTAAVVYLNVPVRLNDQVSVRGVFRDIASPGAATGTTSIFESQQEFFVGVTIDRGIASTEVVGFQLHNATGNTNGAAVSVRAGGNRGVTMTMAGQHTASGSNTQVLPMAFDWINAHVGIAAGVRLTKDPAASSASAVIGATIKNAKAEVDLAAHLGTERSAFSMAGPTILSFVSSTRSGGTVTASFKAGSSAAVFAQVQIEQLVAGAGHYSSVAGGVRFALNHK